MTDSGVYSELMKLEHKKTVFAALHRGGSSIFQSLVMHILKLKYITDSNLDPLAES